MADARFFDRQGPFALSEIADAAGASLAAGCEPDREFLDVGPLQTAGPDEISFLDNPKYASHFAQSNAGACLVAPVHKGSAPEGMALIISDTPYLGYARVASLFYPVVAPASPDTSRPIHETARIATDATIGPGAVIGPGVEIGKGTVIGPGAQIGRGVVIGDDCRIQSDVTITHAILGNRVEILPGVRIGQEGFAFAPDPPGYLTVPQLGRVLIGDDVSIGANSTIDRGAGPDTVIGEACRIDNLVHIAHNVVLGRGCVLAAQVGISGSSRLGDYVVMAGQVGVAGHLTIASGVTLAGKSGVTKDLTEPGTYGGFPAVPIMDWRREVAQIRRQAKKRSRD